MNTTQYAHLITDKTLCRDIDTSGTASEHALGDLARQAGHASLTAVLNEWDAWGLTVGEVAEMLMTDPQD